MNSNTLKKQKSHCGYYIPKNPEKYKGKGKIRVMSSWETAFCEWADRSQGIVAWSSEETVVKYQDPIQPIRNGKPKFRSYFPDFLIQTSNGEIYLIEVKPYKQTIPPRRSSAKSQKTMLTESNAWKTNQAKWRAAKAYCARKKWTFKIITEKELFGKNNGN